jgi:ATP-dependent DNA helicase DinG
MAQAVASIIDDGGTLLAEAGTGTGKTLAYLVPAILSGQRLLVSTGTKNLQEQILSKDLPALREALPTPFTATLMKGRGNYLCLHRWELYRHGADGRAMSGALIESGDRAMLPIVEEWLERTATGDRAELTDLPEDLPFWHEVAAEASSCLGSDCPRYSDCFVTRMRQRAAEADVVIVNHHLLCADAAVRQSAYGEVIPPCPTLVVDEAHQLEEVATQYFGISASTFRVDELVRDGQRVPGARAPDILDALARVAEAGRAFFDDIRAALTSHHPENGGPRRTVTGDSRIRYTAESVLGHVERGVELIGALDRLETLLMPGRDSPARAQDGGAPGSADATAAADADAGLDDQATATLRRRAGELRQDLRHLLRADDPDYVYFVEARGRGLFMRAAPINVSQIVREAILDRFRSVLLTSATLAVDQSFDYARRRLGPRHPQELRVPSEFDFATQALLYLPRRMPPPNAPAFVPAAAREAIEILKRSHGRAFVLFTSHAAMRASEPLLRMALPYPLFVQGTAQRSLLVEQFRRTPHAVLLGTSSFWQGVDVVGEALSCVIIDRLPFASPGDPVTAARIDAIRAGGGDAFADYQVPLAILTLLQGLGRLIRHRGDRGVLAILDPRLRTMGYGRRFLASLPPSPVTYDLDTVGQFFK